MESKLLKKLRFHCLELFGVVERQKLVKVVGLVVRGSLQVVDLIERNPRGEIHICTTTGWCSF